MACIFVRYGFVKPVLGSVKGVIIQPRYFTLKPRRLKKSESLGLVGDNPILHPLYAIRFGQRHLSSNHTAGEASRKWTTRQKLIVGLGGIFGVALVLRLVGTDKADNKDKEEIYVDTKSKDKNGLMKISGVWLPRVMFGSKLWQDIKLFPVNPDDIFVISYPKSGTTWVQEIVYLLLNVDNIDQASKQSLSAVFPYLEFPYPGLEAILETRTIKTHLPFELLPRDVERVKPKIIYVARNVKDVSVSYYHFHRSMAQVSYSGSFTDFLENFLLGRVSYDSWWKHVRSFWERRNDDNIHFVKYEDLKQNPVKEVAAIAKFLNVSASEAQLKNIAEKCSFMQMRENPATNNSWMEEYGLCNKVKDKDMLFMRKGIVGDWKNYYSADLAKIFDEKTEKELSSVGLEFDDGS